METSPRSASPRRLGALGCWLPVSLPAVLLGCTAVPITSSPALAQSAFESPAVAIGDPGTSTDSQLMFEIMIAELAGRRGQLDVALDGYLRAYPRTDDERVAERATRLAIYAQDWPAAEAAIDHWSDLDPESQEAQELRAQVLMRSGRLEDAAASFQEYVRLAPDQQMAWQDVGNILLRDPDPSAAAEVANELVALDPDNAQASLVAARLALANSDIDSARLALDRTLELSPGDTGARLLRARISAQDGDMDDALASLSEARAAEPGDLNLQFGEAEMLVEAGKYQEAVDAVDDLGEVLLAQGDAVNPDALLTIGGLATQLGVLDKAERWYSALLATGVHQEHARFQLARITDRLGRLAEAADHYEAVPPGDRYVPSQVRAAELRAEGGDMGAARERLQMLRSAVPDPSIKSQLVAAEGRILQQAGELDAAIDVLTSGLEEHPDDSGLLYARALVADTAGKGDVLEADLGRLIESEPDNAHALNALGYYLVDDDARLDDAAIYIEKASSLRPDDPAIMDSLGWLRFRQGQTAEAIEHLQRAWQMLPDPEIASHLIEALWAEGREDEARQVHSDALQLMPDDKSLGRLIDRLAQ